MAWHAVALENELQAGQMKRIAPAGHALLLACTEGRVLYCVNELCSHEDYSLWFGCIKGETVKCSLHGSYFDLASGQPLNEPADCALKTYPVKVQDGQVWVDA